MHDGWWSTCGVIVVYADSIGLLVLDVMPIDIIIAIDIVTTLRGSINCSTVICSPTVYLLSWEKPLVNTTAPGSIHMHRLHLRFYFALLLCCFQFSLGKQSIRDWQPLHSVGCKLLCLCRILWYSSTGLIPWFSNWGKYLPPLCYITLSASREHQRKAPRPRGKSFAYLPRKSLKA